MTKMTQMTPYPPWYNLFQYKTPSNCQLNSRIVNKPFKC